MIASQCFLSPSPSVVNHHLANHPDLSLVSITKMSIWEGPYQEMDPLTLGATINLQLADTEEIIANAKGKQAEGTLNDAQMALQLYTWELEGCKAMLSDRAMAQSIAIAVIRDGDVIDAAARLEEQLARDRAFAENLEWNTSHGGAPADVSQSEGDPWHDAEMLSKAAALYMFESEWPLSQHAFEDAEGDTAESSAQGAEPKQTKRQRQGHCVACDEDKPFVNVARVPCNHEYCRACLSDLFRLSMTDESLFPPRCCRQSIPLARVRLFLPSDLARLFETKSVELGTKNRTYCHDTRCSTFISPAAVVGDIGRCPRCEKATCVICKAVSHSGDCPEDTALHQLVETAHSEQWQRCLDCYRFVELDTGCNHI